MEIADTLEGVRSEIFQHFNSLVDYVFKTPRFIEGQIELERRKLDDYFPDQSGPDADPQVQLLRNLRWSHESAKIFDDFPLYMAASNLFLAASLFERFLYDICKEVDGEKAQLTNQRGNGVQRYFSFLRISGLLPERVGLYPQIDAAITVRNALLHADSRMEICRDKVKIERLIIDLLYFEPTRRPGGPHYNENGLPEVAILRNPDQLVIDNYYAVRVTAYFKDFLLELAKHAVGKVAAHPR